MILQEVNDLSTQVFFFKRIFFKQKVAVHVTPNLRRYDGDVMVIGDPFSNGFPIPSGMWSFAEEYMCPGECITQQIHFFAALSQMHRIGSQFWLTLTNGVTNAETESKLYLTSAASSSAATTTIRIIYNNNKKKNNLDDK